MQLHHLFLVFSDGYLKNSTILKMHTSMEIHGNETLLEIHHKIAESISGWLQQKMNEKSIDYWKKKLSHCCYTLNEKIFLSLKFDLLSSHFLLDVFYVFTVYDKGWNEKSTFWEVENVNSFLVGSWKFMMLREWEGEKKKLSTMRINRSILCNHF